MTRERDSQLGLYAASVHETLERLLDKVTFFSTYLPCAFKLIVVICCFHLVVVYHSYTPIRCSCTSFILSFYAVTISFIEFRSPCNKSYIVDYWIISYHLSYTFFFFYLAEKKELGQIQFRYCSTVSHCSSASHADQAHGAVLG